MKEFNRIESKRLKHSIGRFWAMGSDWREVPLSHLYDFRSGLSKPRSEFGFGYGFLSFKDVFYNFFIPEKLSELVNSTEKEREYCSIRKGDVFLTRTSETMEDLGMSCVALKDYESATFNGFTKRLRPKSNTRIVPEYAAYFFRSPKFRSEVTAMSSLSTRASLNNEMLGRLKMILPGVEEQAAIGFILRSLDDKVELNRRMNETLEAMARAIFKSWFVAFDPVRAKAEGRDPGLPDEVAALFPDSFEDSELGGIPKGWRIVSLSEVLSLIGGGTPETKVKEYWGGDIPSCSSRPKCKHRMTSSSDSYFTLITTSRSSHLARQSCRFSSPTSQQQQRITSGYTRFRTR
jgi:type I restriction enzyme S subunit